MKNLSKCQEMMTIQQEIYQIICIIKNIKLIRIDLSRQINTSIPQKINFVGKLEETDGTRVFLLLNSSKKLF